MSAPFAPPGDLLRRCHDGHCLHQRLAHSLDGRECFATDCDCLGFLDPPSGAEHEFDCCACGHAEDDHEERSIDGDYPDPPEFPCRLVGCDCAGWRA